MIEVDDLSRLVSGEDSMLEEMMTSGQGQAATQLISTLSSILNSRTDLMAVRKQKTQRKQVMKLIMAYIIMIA